MVARGVNQNIEGSKTVNITEQLALDALQKILIQPENAQSIAQKTIDTLQVLTLNRGLEKQVDQSINFSFNQLRQDLIECDIERERFRAALKEIMQYAFNPETVASIADAALNGGQLPSKTFNHKTGKYE